MWKKVLEKWNEKVGGMTVSLGWLQTPPAQQPTPNGGPGLRKQHEKGNSPPGTAC